MGLIVLLTKGSELLLEFFASKVDVVDLRANGSVRQLL